VRHSQALSGRVMIEPPNTSAETWCAVSEIRSICFGVNGLSRASQMQVLRLR
jgi:hypothetical protein